MLADMFYDEDSLEFPGEKSKVDGPIPRLKYRRLVCTRDGHTMVDSPTYMYIEKEVN